MVRNTFICLKGVFTLKGQTPCVCHSVFILLQACMPYAKPPSLSFEFFLSGETKQCKNAHAAWTERCVDLLCEAQHQLCRLQHHTCALQAHSAMEFYCLSAASLIYAVNRARGQDTAGEKNLELHFQLH